jgi:hypothetical protein
MRANIGYMDFSSYQLTEFNLSETIKLGSKAGLIRLQRSEDGILCLISDSNANIIDQTQVTKARISDPDAILGFVLDIGIRKEKQLTSGGGHYFGHQWINAQSMKPIRQTDYDEVLMEKILNRVDNDFQSGDTKKEIDAVRLQYLLKSYNQARLLFPNFFNESYLCLMRIIDAIVDAKTRRLFAFLGASLAPNAGLDIYGKIVAVGGYAARITLAENLFKRELADAIKEKAPYASRLGALPKHLQFVFACLFSAYKYRNEFVHHGFPFPDTIKDSDSTTAGGSYLFPAEAILILRHHNPNGVVPGDLIDVHSFISKPQEAKDFQDIYFKLIPTWKYMRDIAREGLMSII